MSLVPICFVDMFDLAASLRTRAGLFSGDDGVRELRVRGERRSGTGMAYSAHVAKWPELKVILGKIERITPVEFGRIVFEWLDQGATKPWQFGNKDYMRAEIAVRTNPRAMIYCGVAAAHLPPGQLTALDVSQPISAINLGEYPRVHLVIEFRRKEASNVGA